MGTVTTEISEIVTGLGLFGFRDLSRALAARPRFITNVDDAVYDRLDVAFESGQYTNLFETAWANGCHFGRADEGLRGRPPWTVEWKGPHKPPAYEQIPADLRVDHVYLLSCKYGSKILMNSSPWNLFDRALNQRSTNRSDWFVEVAPEALQEMYAATVAELDDASAGLPDLVVDLDSGHRDFLKKVLRAGWPTAMTEQVRAFTHAVSHESAVRWQAQMKTPAQREEMLWRILRLQAAPYFVLGADHSGEPLRYRVSTPWDFRNRFHLRAFDVFGDAGGQPRVRWRADVDDNETGQHRIVEGHVEVRWSRGKFGGAPEAKVYLDTPAHEVAGYLPLR